MAGLAAIQYVPDGFDPRLKMMGRQMAGETFLGAWIAHSGADPFTAYVKTQEDAVALRSHAARLGHSGPIEIASIAAPAPLQAAGALWLGDPSLAAYAQDRSWSGDAAWSIVGITHTMSSHAAMDRVAALVTAPVRPWDALVCTSRPVKAAVERTLAAEIEILDRRFGVAIAPPLPELPVIPLGVPCDALAPLPSDRQRWRAELGIGDADVAILQYGRLALHAKAHPLPLYVALAEAAERAPARLHLILAGKFINAPSEALFRQLAGYYADPVTTHFVDGDRADLAGVRAAADIGTLMSDNIQESFGLAPVELMAAGLPVIGTDWDGLRDTIEHKVSGFLIPTTMPPPGAGSSIARHHAFGLAPNDFLVGAAAQSTAFDIGQAVDAFAALAGDPERRRSMGEAAQMRARAFFDWPVVIARYRALLEELAKCRAAGALAMVKAPLPPSARLDPFDNFTAHASEAIRPDMRVGLRPGGFARIGDLPGGPELALLAPGALPSAQIMDTILDRLAAGPCSIAELAASAPNAAAPQLHRAIGMLLKYGFLSRA
jgi:starch synthase